jgi:hypothetical protein
MRTVHARGGDHFAAGIRDGKGHGLVESARGGDAGGDSFFGFDQAETEGIATSR